jgi:hypothetical protein
MSRWPITWRSRRWRLAVWRWPTVTPPIVPPAAPPKFVDRKERPGTDDNVPQDGGE